MEEPRCCLCRALRRHRHQFLVGFFCASLRLLQRHGLDSCADSSPRGFDSCLTFVPGIVYSSFAPFVLHFSSRTLSM